jgi:uncharacterized protein (DUF362 family)
MANVFVGKINGDLEKKTLACLDWLEWEKIVKPQARVFIKPNFTYPTYKCGVTTSPQFLETLVRILGARTRNITIGETDGGYCAWKAEEAFSNHKLYDLKKRYGIGVLNLYDSEIEHRSLVVKNRVYEIPLPRFLLKEVDVFISAPVLKIHSMVDFTFGLKNQWGCILDPFRMRFHHIFKEAVLAINEWLQPKIIISDPLYMLTDKGPMEGNACVLNNIIACDDVFVFDAVGAKILGFQPGQISYLAYAKELGKIPSWPSFKMNSDINAFVMEQSKITRNLKDKFVRRIFGSSFLTYLLYYSRFGILIHKIYYFFIGKKNQIK